MASLMEFHRQHMLHNTSKESLSVVVVVFQFNSIMGLKLTPKIFNHKLNHKI
jgi:hypothetical protein